METKHDHAVNMARLDDIMRVLPPGDRLFLAEALAVHEKSSQIVMHWIDRIQEMKMMIDFVRSMDEAFPDSVALKPTAIMSTLNEMTDFMKENEVIDAGAMAMETLIKRGLI